MSDNESGERGDNSPWQGDLLGYENIGITFTNLIKSIDDSKVLSIEAGFGRGKTFFRKSWAQHLRDEGEVVIEIDAQLSDHSGDPVVTFIGALMAQLPEKDQSRFLKAWATGKKIFWGGTKIGASVVARQAGAEAVEKLETYLSSDGAESFSDKLITEIGDDVSKELSGLISRQMSAERVRKQEMPEQLEALRMSLVEGKDQDRVVILIDELDRCHPEYAIALLEAMKLVFGQYGFVFCLMVNDKYLENLAAHRFGATEEGERYLDKFVDVRLKLPDTAEVRAAAARELALGLPLEIPFGDGEAFSVEAAADLTQRIVKDNDLSMRRIKRVLLRVDLALRCYREQPIDCVLLIFLGFRDATVRIGDGSFQLSKDLLPRSNLTPLEGEKMRGSDHFGRQSKKAHTVEEFFKDNAPELFGLPLDRYNLPDQQNYYDWAKVGSFLAPTYIKSHKDMLDGVRELEA